MGRLLVERTKVERTAEHLMREAGTRQISLQERFRQTRTDVANTPLAALIQRTIDFMTENRFSTADMEDLRHSLLTLQPLLQTYSKQLRTKGLQLTDAERQAMVEKKIRYRVWVNMMESCVGIVRSLLKDLLHSFSARENLRKGTHAAAVATTALSLSEMRDLKKPEEPLTLEEPTFGDPSYPQVYISVSPENLEIAFSAKTGLRERGFTVWCAREKGDNMRGTTAVEDDANKEAIVGCELFLAIFSVAYLKSPACLADTAWARMHKKHIVFILVDGTEPLPDNWGEYEEFRHVKQIPARSLGVDAEGDKTVEAVVAHINHVIPANMMMERTLVALAHETRKLRLFPLALASALDPHHPDSPPEDVSLFLEHPRAKDFWLRHFSATEPSIEWPRFASAFQTQFQERLNEADLKRFRRLLDINADGRVDVYEFGLLTDELGVWDSYVTLMCEQWQDDFHLTVDHAEKALEKMNPPCKPVQRTVLVKGGGLKAEMIRGGSGFLGEMVASFGAVDRALDFETGVLVEFVSLKAKHHFLDEKGYEALMQLDASLADLVVENAPMDIDEALKHVHSRREKMQKQVVVVARARQQNILPQVGAVGKTPEETILEMMRLKEHALIMLEKKDSILAHLRDIKETIMRLGRSLRIPASVLHPLNYSAPSLATIIAAADPSADELSSEAGRHSSPQRRSRRSSRLKRSAHRSRGEESRSRSGGKSSSRGKSRRQSSRRLSKHASNTSAGTMGEDGSDSLPRPPRTPLFQNQPPVLETGESSEEEGKPRRRSSKLSSVGRRRRSLLPQARRKQSMSMAPPPLPGDHSSKSPYPGAGSRAVHELTAMVRNLEIDNADLKRKVASVEVLLNSKDQKLKVLLRERYRFSNMKCQVCGSSMMSLPYLQSIRSFGFKSDGENPLAHLRKTTPRTPSYAPDQSTSAAANPAEAPSGGTEGDVPSTVTTNAQESKEFSHEAEENAPTTTRDASEQLLQDDYNDFERLVDSNLLLMQQAVVPDEANSPVDDSSSSEEEEKPDKKGKQGPANEEAELFGDAAPILNYKESSRRALVGANLEHRSIVSLVAHSRSEVFTDPGRGVRSTQGVALRAAAAATAAAAEAAVQTKNRIIEMENKRRMQRLRKIAALLEVVEEADSPGEKCAEDVEEERLQKGSRLQLAAGKDRRGVSLAPISSYSMSGRRIEKTSPAAALLKKWRTEQGTQPELAERLREEGMAHMLLMHTAGMLHGPSQSNPQLDALLSARNAASPGSPALIALSPRLAASPRLSGILASPGSPHPPIGPPTPRALRAKKARISSVSTVGVDVDSDSVPMNAAALFLQQHQLRSPRSSPRMIRMPNLPSPRGFDADRVGARTPPARTSDLDTLRTPGLDTLQATSPHDISLEIPGIGRTRRRAYTDLGE